MGRPSSCGRLRRRRKYQPRSQRPQEILSRLVNNRRILPPPLESGMMSQSPSHTFLQHRKQHSRSVSITKLQEGPIKPKHLAPHLYILLFDHSTEGPGTIPSFLVNQTWRSLRRWLVLGVPGLPGSVAHPRSRPERAGPTARRRRNLHLSRSRATVQSRYRPMPNSLPKPLSIDLLLHTKSTFLYRLVLRILH